MRAAIFDMDGTLLDTMHFWFRLGYRFLLDHGMAADDALVRAVDGLPSRKAAALIAEQDPFHMGLDGEGILQRHFYPAMGRIYRTEAQPRPGARDYLAKLQSQGIACCVVTATPLDFALPALASTGLLAFLRFAASETSLGFSKHDARCFEAAAARLSVKTTECVVFEDALYAIQGAKTAGCTVFAVEEASAVSQREDIRAGCDVYFQSFQEIMGAPFPCIG